MKTVAERANRGRVILAWCLSAMFVIALAGCGSETPNTSDSNEVTPAATAAPLETAPPAETPAPAPAEPAEPARAPNDPVVTVNGQTITEAQVSNMVNVQIQRMGGQMASLPAALIDRYKQQMRQRVVEGLVAETLLDQRIVAANIVVTEEQVVNAIETEGAKRTPPITIDKFKEMVEAQGGNFQDVLSQYKKRMARQQYLEAQWAGKIDVNDAEVQAYYDEHPKEFETPEQVQASHILIKPDASDPNNADAAKAAAKAEAEKLLAQVKDGADFAELATAHSDCPSARQGGDLGLFGHNQMVPPFEAAAFALEPGQVSDVVETQFGYHIIKVTDKKAAQTTPFEEAKEGITETLANEKKMTFSEALLNTMKDEATIVYAAGAEPAPPAPMMPRPPAGSTPN